MLIIDAYNVLHTDGVLPAHLAAPGVPGLVRLLATSRYASRDITIVCDGGASAADSGVRMDPVRVLYSGGGREADDVIEDLINRYHRGNALEIVSSDRRLKKAARRKRAGCIESAAFLTALAADASRTPKARGSVMRAQVPLDAYSVSAWLEEFGFDASLARKSVRAGPTKRSSGQPPIGDGSASDRAKTGPNPRKLAKRASSDGKSSLGERLQIELPRGAEKPAVPPAHPPPQRSGSTPVARPSKRIPAVPGLVAIDPLLIEALEEWRDRLSLDDLTMQQWVPDATPLAKRPPRSS